MKKRMGSLILALALCLGLVVPASAHDMAVPGQKNTISAGAFHTAAIDENGSLWTWGSNGSGQLGNGTTDDSAIPVKVLEDVVFVSCGSYSTAAIKTDGSLWMWGQNSYGELGNGGYGNVQETRGNYRSTIQTIPIKIMDNVAFVACAGHVEHYTAAIKTDGSLWTWGENDYGQLGNGSLENSNVPVKVMDNVTAVSCGMAHVAAIKTNGSLWTWGMNGCGELGNGGVGNTAITLGGREAPVQTVPTKIMDNVTAVSCGNESTAAVKTDGTLWMWGVAYRGALGNGKSPVWGDTDFTQKTPVKVMDGVRAVSCFGGDDDLATAAIKTDGSLWMWGGNWYGMLGCGNVVNIPDEDGGNSGGCQTVPKKIMDGVISVSGGMAHGVAQKEDGTLWTWGDNGRGQLGNGGIGNSVRYGDIIQTIPVQVPNLTAKLPVTSLAYASTQSVLVDGKTVEFPCYALKDANGNDTNYIKLRDVAQILNGTPAQFEVTWDGAVNIVTGQPYTPNGTELKPPFSGNRLYTVPAAQTKVNGAAADLDAIVLTDDAGNGYTYYKLRDLGSALGFSVDWSADKGIFIDTK